MPPRSQLLMLSGTLAIGMIVGSLALAILRPAVSTNTKADPKAEKPEIQVAPPAAPAVAKAAPKGEKPATEVAHPVVPAVAKTAPKAEESRPTGFFPAPPPEVADLAAQADQKAAPEAAKPKPEDVLANKGLKRLDQVHILKADEDIRKKREILKLRYDTELRPIQRQLFSLWMDYKAQQGRLDELQQMQGIVAGLIDQADGNKNGRLSNPVPTPCGGPQPVPNAPFGQQPVPNAPFGQQPVPNAPFGPQPVPDAPFGQQPGNNGLPGPNEGGMKPKKGDQEPKKPTRAQLAEQFTETDEEIKRTEFKMDQLERAYRNSWFKADLIVSALESKERLLIIEFEDVKKQYDELGKDPLVATALQELNKNPGPRVVLGPVEDKWVNLKKLHEDLLRGMRLVPVRKQKGKGGNGNAQGLEASSKASDKALQEALKKQNQERMLSTSRKQRLADWPKTRKAGLERIAKARTPVEKLEADARLKNAEEGIKEDERKESQAEETRKKRSQEVAVTRKAFVEDVAALDKAVEEPNVKQAINFKELKKYLVAAKKRIKTEQIKLDPDKANLWVYVILNEDNEPAKMVVDHGLDVIQMSEAFADAQGIRPLDTDPRIDVALANGQTFSATRIKLKAVRVGSFKITDVECLVFAKGFDDFPQLGASFLDHFRFEMDAGEAKLTLTKVD